MASNSPARAPQTVRDLTKILGQQYETEQFEITINNTVRAQLATDEMVARVNSHIGPSSSLQCVRRGNDQWSLRIEIEEPAADSLGRDTIGIEHYSAWFALLMFARGLNQGTRFTIDVCFGRIMSRLPSATNVLVENLPVPPTTQIMKRGYTNLKVQVMSSPTGEKTTLCIDSGAACDGVSRAWLKKHGFEHTIHTDVEGLSIEGINGPGHAVRVTEYAKMRFYTFAKVTGHDEDYSTLVQLSAQPWVMEELGDNCLLGSVWLDPRKALIDYDKKTVTLRTPSTPQIEIPFKIRRDQDDGANAQPGSGIEAATLKSMLRMLTGP